MDVHECTCYLFADLIDVSLESHVGVEVYPKVFDVSVGFDCSVVKSNGGVGRYFGD